MAEAAKSNKVLFKWIWIAVAALLIIIGQFGPLWSPDLTREGQAAIMVLLAAVVMWATEALPLPITSLVMVAMCGFLAIAPYNDIWAATFTGSLWMFIGIFGFTTFLGVSTFPQRLIAMVVRLVKGKINLVILGFMIICCVISVVMSNIALTAIMMGFAASLLRAADAEPGKSNLGRCLALAIPFAVMFGGCLLPSGTPINVVVLGLAETACGVTISFAEWFGYTIIPVTLSLLACWIILIKVYKPEPLSQETVDKFLNEVSSLPPMDFKEKFNIGVLLVALVCWIASSWIPALNTTFVALVALGLLFLPGTSMITTKQYRSESPWDILLMMASINGIVAAMSAAGSVAWIVNLLLGVTSGMSFVMLFLVISVVLAIVHNFFPSGPGLAALVTAPVLGLVAAVGGNFTATILMLALWCALCFLVPLDSVLLVSYAGGYYKFNEMWKGGLPVTLATMVFFSAFLLIVPPLLGAA
ncbi:MULTISPECIES: SLC13 family permease [Gordonibacter]|uniref:SLC13 family permease n=1 Tax=Gordonibacter faecis TaxID=3047475 RepID=A0ABT7DQE9_9ACTN|nr:MULTISPECIES: SLC13 family permease [unclassified Gordonibacter]MDJ1651774.1 SLC13 family permease [Gordonibacter sp. KGMB12511]HIW75691.1 anion permease [Candidatus Gordonibacter avicola]